jgi:hypothetical protein
MENEQKQENVNVETNVSVEDLISQAKTAKEELAQERSKIEQLMARQMLSGKSFSGQTVMEKSPEETKKEQAIEFFKGTEIEKAIRKHG